MPTDSPQDNAFEDIDASYYYYYTTYNITMYKNRV